MKGNLYKITNKINNKSYIGKTYLTIEERFKQHISDSKKQSHRPLYKAFNKYGIDNFELTLLGEFEENILEEKEIYYIDFYDTYKHGYNATLGGDGKRYLQFTDKDVIDKYNELKHIRLTAKHFNCCVDIISMILNKNNIEVKDPQCKPIIINELNQKFESLNQCAQWLIDNEYTSGSLSHVRYGIRRCLNGDRKTYLKFTFTR